MPPPGPSRHPRCASLCLEIVNYPSPIHPCKRRPGRARAGENASRHDPHPSLPVAFALVLDHRQSAPSTHTEMQTSGQDHSATTIAHTTSRRSSALQLSNAQTLVRTRYYPRGRVSEAGCRINEPRLRADSSIECHRVVKAQIQTSARLHRRAPGRSLFIIMAGPTEVPAVCTAESWVIDRASEQCL